MRSGLIFQGAILAATLLVSGCGNPYAQFFQPASPLVLQDLPERRLTAPPPEPRLYHGNDPRADNLAMAADGYIEIGQSSYNGPRGSDRQALAEGKALGADVVATYKKYTRTVHTMAPMTLPTMQTSFTNGSATAFGPGGTATAFGSAITTTYGTETTYIPLSVDRYDFFAVYYVRVKQVFGAYFNDLTPEETQRFGTVNGVVVRVVARGSPAAAAGILPGDVITATNGEAITDVVQLTPWLRRHKGERATFSVIRAGRMIQIPVSLGSY